MKEESKQWQQRKERLEELEKVMAINAAKVEDLVHMNVGMYTFCFLNLIINNINTRRTAILHNKSNFTTSQRNFLWVHADCSLQSKR